MAKITVATFNCENLFRRFKFTNKAKPEKINNAVENGFIIDKTLFETILDPERELTAKAILDCKADIVCLVEVENFDTLKSFVSKFLTGKNYKYNILIDGNDPRLIDVALISKIPFDHVVTHQYDRTINNKALMFSRDCLEVKFTIDGKPFYVFVNHFKSMLDKNDPANGRKNTAARRKEQAEAVANILKERFGSNPGNASWIVTGDLNDYPDKDTSLKPLIDNAWIENVVQTRIDEKDSWTHFWDTSSKKVSDDEKYKQIDYILLSKQLADKNKNSKPVIIRKGLCLNADKYTGTRYEGIGKSRPAASDHCPVAITIDI